MTDISRPVITGGFVLTLISGIVNAVGFMSFAHTGLTHMTGLTTHISIYLGNSEYQNAILLSSLIIAFIFGALLSGFIIQKSTLKLGRNYGFVLLLEGALLLASIGLLQKNMFFGEILVACACGLQNAMATTYSGSILRTTHLTGIFTDLGLWLGHKLRRLPVEIISLKIYISLISGFFCGGIFGVLLFEVFTYYALIVPVILLGLSGGLYIYMAYKAVNDDS